VALAGHLVRMNNDRTLKKIFTFKPDGVRSVGRPKLRLEDGVDQDTVIPRLTKIIRFGITFVSRNVIPRRFL